MILATYIMDRARFILLIEFDRTGAKSIQIIEYTYHLYYIFIKDEYLSKLITRKSENTRGG